MLPSASESAGWGNGRCGTEQPPEGRGMMREGDRLISRRLGRVLRGQRRRGRMGRRMRRNRRVGGGWTGRMGKDTLGILAISVYKLGQTLINSVKTGSKSSSLPSKNG